MVNNYVKYCDQLSAYSLFIQPYVDGVRNCKIATAGLGSKIAHCFSKKAQTANSTPLKERVKHFAAGIGLLTPLVNAVVFLFLRHFCTSSGNNKPTSSPQSNNNKPAGGPQPVLINQQGLGQKKANNNRQAGGPQSNNNNNNNKPAGGPQPTLTNQQGLNQKKAKTSLKRNNDQSTSTPQNKKRRIQFGNERVRQFDKEKPPKAVRDIDSLTRAL